MKQQWKLLIPLMLSGGLVACSSAPKEGEVTDQPVQVEQPAQEVSKSEQDTDGKATVDSNTGTTTGAKPQPAKPAEPVQAKKTEDGRLILGEQEWVYVTGLKQNFRARIDTGATTSSVSAIDVVPFERDGKDWVKFRIAHDDVTSEEFALPVERWVDIRQSSTEEKQRRAVVMAWIEVGDVKEKTEFTLTDRSHLKYPILLGRSFFKDIALIDVNLKYVQSKHK